MKGRVGYIFLLLCIGFVVFSFNLYLNPGTRTASGSYGILASQGRMVWQKYNCQACHQLYGLGGYLGPDLTNLYSKTHKNETAIKALIRSGNARMPGYNLPQDEMDKLIAYFKAMDLSGKADPRNFNTNKYGWIESK